MVVVTHSTTVQILRILKTYPEVELPQVPIVSHVVPISRPITATSECTGNVFRGVDGDFDHGLHLDRLARDAKVTHLLLVLGPNFRRRTLNRDADPIAVDIQWDLEQLHGKGNEFL